MRIWSRLAIGAGAWLLLAGAAPAQEAQPAPAFPPIQSITELVEADPATADAPGRVSSAVEVAIVLTIVSILPSLLMTVTSFLRIMIVLSFVRRAIGTPELPPNQILAGLGLFLTLFIMYPVGSRIYDGAVDPYMKGEMTLKSAGEKAAGELSDFMIKQTREADLALFVQLAEMERPESPKDIPLRVVVPAFILSELKTGFQMGFVVFLPFLVIDLVVSSILLSMGMFMLPPVVISTPFKILLFVLVDGWNLLLRSLVVSFN